MTYEEWIGGEQWQRAAGQTGGRPFHGARQTAPEAETTRAWVTRHHEQGGGVLGAATFADGQGKEIQTILVRGRPT